MALEVPGYRDRFDRTSGGLGDEATGGIFGGILNFIPATLQAAGGIAGSVPGILAATGNKKAISYMTQQASLECSKAGGDWLGTTCDMTAVNAARAATEQKRAGVDAIKAYAPWVALGIGGLGLTYAAVKAITSPRPPVAVSGKKGASK